MNTISELVTTERLLILALVFCMGARQIRAYWNGKVIGIDAGKNPDE